MSEIIGKKHFPVDLCVLDQMLEFVLKQYSSLKLPNQNYLHVELAAEEALTNVIQHSGLKNSDFLTIVCEVLHPVNQIVITIHDPGMHFNPLLKHSDLSNADGLGVHLFKSLMSKIEYQRINNQNILSLYFIVPV